MMYVHDSNQDVIIYNHDKPFNFEIDEIGRNQGN